MTITPALTKADVRAMRPCEDDYKQACQALPDWENTAYTPSQMAAHGVKHSLVIWAWVRDDIMGRVHLVEFACRCAEGVLHLFKDARPGDERPQKAIAAARRYDLDPTPENKKAAGAAADAAWAAEAAVWGAGAAARAAREAAAAALAALAAARAAEAAARVAARAAQAAARAAEAAARAAEADARAARAARAAEQSRQIKILEAIIAEANQ